MEKFFFSLVIFNAIAFGHSFSCTPNATFANDCNTCHCNAEGTNAICTQMGCSEEVFLATTTEETIATTHINGNQVCTPNEIKMEVETNGTCNRCKCAANGIGWFCTKIICPPREVHTRSVSSAKSKRQAPEQQCTPGEEWKEDCNTCWCSPTGLKACTRAFCPQPPPKRRLKRSQCTPGETWKEACNDCHCSSDGFAVCTERGCLSKRQAPVPAGHCTPGDTWTEDCNTCFCSSGGHIGCTLVACGPSTPTNRSIVFKRQAPAPVSQCTPGDRWKEDCNTCWCTPTGLKACTRMACLPQRSKRQVQQGNQCKSGDTWMDDCNRCWCENGYAACTRMACLPTRSKRQSQEPEQTTTQIPQGNQCKHGDRWMEDCNRCWCHNGYAACTLMGCGRSRSRRQAQCTPGDSWKDDCNTCFCTPTGLAACTRMACLPQRSKRQSTSQIPQGSQCKDGDTWMDDCNRCWCQNGYAACTKMGCPDRHKRQTTCTPGDSWEENCNTCICTDQGYPVCTMMACQRRFKRQVEGSNDSNKCTPGTRWRKACNDCFCTETGIAACTLRGCLGRHEGNHGHLQRPHIAQSQGRTVTEEEFNKPDFQCTPQEFFKVDCNTCHCAADGKHAKCSRKQCVNGQ